MWAQQWHVRHLDVDTAYLNANLNAEIYISQPLGFEVQNQGEPLVCKLRKAIYGLKQALLKWYKHLTKLLTALGFTSSASDKCLFIKHSDTLILVATYVNDILLASPSLEETLAFERALSAKIKIKIMGEVNHILGWKVDVNPSGSVSITQAAYIHRVLERFNMTNCNPVTTPALRAQQHVQPDNIEDDSNFPYREAI